MESAVTEIVRLGGKLMLLLPPNSRAIARRSKEPNTDEWIATTPASARAAGPVALPDAAKAAVPHCPTASETTKTVSFFIDLSSLVPLPYGVDRFLNLYQRMISTALGPNEIFGPNLAASSCFGWTGRLTGTAIFYVRLVWLGFEPRAVALASALNLLYPFWLRAESIQRLGWLEYVLHTPPTIAGTTPPIPNISTQLWRGAHHPGPHVRHFRC
jgi:hypothetical protein